MPTATPTATTVRKPQLLGFAFASADLMFEVTADGRVRLALGAVGQVTGRDEAEFVGSDWRELVVAEDADLLKVIAERLKPGQRLGPFNVTLAASRGQPARTASLSVFQLPSPGAAISCAVSLAPTRATGPHQANGQQLAPDDFLAVAAGLLDEAKRAGLPLRLDLIELPGLEAAAKSMEAPRADALRRKVAVLLRAESVGGAGAAQLADDRFALLRDHEAPKGLANSLSELGFVPASVELQLDGNAAQDLRAMRYALDRYIEDGPKAAAAGFKAAVERTVRETANFKRALGDGDFRLAYQPVIHLKTQALHHFEALARFDRNVSPADNIRLAEELGLIVDFDLAVAGLVADVLAAGSPNLKIAVNVSAVSLMTPSFVESLVVRTASHADIRPRMLLEITETRALADLPAANRILGMLRRLGHIVCLDDFGAGASSLDYLRHLDADVAKIDGRYVQGLESRPRDAILLRHIAALCRELNVATIAEMVETRETAAFVEDLELDFGQGWYFGQPLDEPNWLMDIPNWRLKPVERRPAQRVDRRTYPEFRRGQDELARVWSPD